MVGRYASGLPTTSTEFASLPPHFPMEVILELENEDWRNVLPGYLNYPECFRRTVPFLLASLVYHWNWLNATLPANHPLRASRVVTEGYIARLQPTVLGGEVTCPVTGLTATGVPYHIMLSSQVAQLEAKVAEMDREVKRARVDVIARIDTMNEELPHKVCDAFLSNFEVNGAVPITRDQIQQLFTTQLKEQLGEHFGMLRNEFRAQVLPPAVPVDAPAAEVPDPPNGGADWWRHWVWGEAFHPVPRGWKLQTGLFVKPMWDLWFFGDRSAGVRPYKHIKGSDLVAGAENQSQRTNLSRLKLVMECLAAIVYDKELIAADRRISDLSRMESDAVFKDAYERLCRRVYNIVDPNDLTELRIYEKSYNTLHQLINKYKNN